MLSPQSFGQMLRNPVYIGRIQCWGYGVATGGDFEPLVSEETFYRAQAVSEGRVQQLLFPEGMTYDGIRFNRIAATTPFFKYLAPGEC